MRRLRRAEGREQRAEQPIEFFDRQKLRFSAAALEQGVHLTDRRSCVQPRRHVDLLHPVALVKADALLVRAE